MFHVEPNLEDDNLNGSIFGRSRVNHVPSLFVSGLCYKYICTLFLFQPDINIVTLTRMMNFYVTYYEKNGEMLCYILYSKVYHFQTAYVVFCSKKNIPRMGVFV